MSARRQPLWFVAALAVCGLLVVGEGWCIYERWSTSRALAKKFVEKQVQLAEMGRLAPAPTRDIAKAIEADLARAQHALVAMQAELKGHGPASEKMQKAKVPTARTDSYFDLASFVERTRELAKKNQVDVRPEAARFGFAAHANEAPEAERIEPVFRQRQIVQYLLESLIEAHPRALLAVKRERPLTKKERDEQDAAALAAAAAVANGQTPEPAPDTSSTDDGPDFFAIDPRVSVRAAGFLHTTAFRLVFVGETGSLRALLNKVASFELPLLVREVEVEPASTEEAMLAAEETTSTDFAAAPASVVLSVNSGAKAAKSSAPKITSTAAPIVAKPFSKFTVTVEYVELVTPPPAEAAPTPPS